MPWTDSISIQQLAQFFFAFREFSFHRLMAFTSIAFSPGFVVAPHPAKVFNVSRSVVGRWLWFSSEPTTHKSEPREGNAPSSRGAQSRRGRTNIYVKFMTKADERKMGLLVPCQCLIVPLHRLSALRCHVVEWHFHSTHIIYASTIRAECNLKIVFMYGMCEETRWHFIGPLRPDVHCDRSWSNVSSHVSTLSHPDAISNRF